MTLLDILRWPTLSRRVRLYFDSSRIGGRRSLVWNPAMQQNYSSYLKGCAPISHRTETSLHSFLTSDVELRVTNEGTGSTGNNPGFWDQNRSLSPLAPVLGILARVVVQVMDPDTNNWTDDLPIYTGVLRNVRSSDQGGEARLETYSISSYLIDEKADSVRNGDSWYSQISINRAVRLLLTQSDQWASINAPDIACIVVVTGSGKMSLERQDGGLFYEDLAQRKPQGIHSGYAIRMTSGTASGKSYTVRTNALGTPSGDGYQRTHCDVVGSVADDGIQVNDTCVLTGFCWPYLGTEVDGFEISTVNGIPTADGLPTISTFGRPPEDGSSGVSEALVHDGDYLWVGVENRLYRYDVTNDTYILYVTLFPNTLRWRRGCWWEDEEHLYFTVWEDSWTTAETTGYVYVVDPAMTPGAWWSTGNAYATLPNLYPGDFHTRHGVRDGGAVPYWRCAGLTSNVVGFAVDDICLFAHLPQQIRAVNITNATTLWRMATVSTLAFGYGVASPVTPPTFDVDEPSYVGLFAQHSSVRPEHMIQFHIGGKLQAIWVTWNPISADNGLYYWAMNPSTRDFSLHHWTPGADTVRHTLNNSFEFPAATWADFGYFYWIAHEFPDGHQTTPAMRMRLYKMAPSTHAITEVWATPANTDPYNYFNWVDACALDQYNAVGCIACCAGVDEGSNAYHQKFILVRNITNAAFWNGVLDGSNVVYVSRRPFTGFYWNALDQSTWWIHYGYNTLWYAKDAGFGRADNYPTVVGDVCLASNLAFADEGSSRYSVYGVSAGEMPRARGNTPMEGQFYLWTFSRRIAPRIELADFSGMNRFEALRMVAEKADHIFYVDPSGSPVFKPRSIGPPYDYTGYGNSLRVDKHYAVAEAHNIVIGTPSVATYEPPKVTFTAVNLDDSGNPILGLTFNGDIFVRQTGRESMRVELTCVVGNAGQFGAETRPVTETYWTVYSEAKSPQYAGSGQAIQYPGGFWNPGNWGIWIRLENAAEGSAYGFVPGDRIVIDCPGMELTSKPEFRAIAQDGALLADDRRTPLDLNNRFIPPHHMRHFCELYLRYYKVIGIALDIEADLLPLYVPLESMNVSNVRLGMPNPVAGVLKEVTHDPFGANGSTSVRWRQWSVPSDPDPEALPAPTLPEAEPADSVDGILPPLAPGLTGAPAGMED